MKVGGLLGSGYIMLDNFWNGKSFDPDWPGLAIPSATEWEPNQHLLKANYVASTKLMALHSLLTSFNLHSSPMHNRPYHYVYFTD